MADIVMVVGMLSSYGPRWTDGGTIFLVLLIVAILAYFSIG